VLGESDYGAGTVDTVRIESPTCCRWYFKAATPFVSRKVHFYFNITELGESDYGAGTVDRVRIESPTCCRWYFKAATVYRL